jgi:hypothetical protein
MLFMTVPTAGSHPELLSQLIQDCGLPPSQIVIVATRPNLSFPEGVIRVEDFGPINIQRWWNLGISESQRRGATAVAVLNDDMWVTPETFSELHESLLSSGAAIASPHRDGERVGLNKGRLVPYTPKIWGCLWMLNLSTDLRPNDEYHWWFGDNDLDIRARRDFGGVVTREVRYEHLHPGQGTGMNPVLAELATQDALVYQRDYARIQTLTRWWNRVASLFGKDVRG